MSAPPTISPPLTYARTCLAHGISVIPIKRNGDKKPAFDRLPRVAAPGNPARKVPSWLPFQSELPDDPTLDRWFGDGECGPAIVGGAVSGGLACLDIETVAAAEVYQVVLDEWCPGLWDRLPRVQTPGAHDAAGKGGIHVYFRFDDPAQVPNSTLTRWPKDGKFTGVIECRCEGKYWLTPGCPPECHPLNKPYIPDRGSPSIRDTPTLTADELHALVMAAKSMDQGPVGASATAAPSPIENVGAATGETAASNGPVGAGDGLTPCDDYDRRGPDWSAEELLGSIGWREVGKDRWRSADKTHVGGWNATTHCKGKGGEPLLSVFSPNARPFDQDKVYGKARAFAVIHHNGDLSAAARALRLKGYGSTTPRATTGGPASPPVADAPAGGGGSAPVGPVVSTAGDGPEPWTTPVPLDSIAPTPMPFPLDAFPSWFAHFVEGVAGSIPCPVDFPASFALAAASGMLGASVSLRVKEGWYEVPSLYLCGIGAPSAGKSPALKAIMRPIYKLHGEAITRSTKPVYSSDVTAEKLAELLKEQPKGLMVIRDELTGWIASMDQYKAKGSGSDRQFFLSAWSGDPINVLRKNPEAPGVFVPHPCLTVVGGTQPDVVAKFRGQDDGFVDRILFSYPAIEKKSWTDATCPPDLVSNWAAAVARLHHTGQTIDGPDRPPRPWIFDMTDDARQTWREFIGWIGDQQESDELPDFMRNPVQKLTNYAPRFACVLHCLRHLTTGKDDYDTIGGVGMDLPAIPAISASTIRGAWDLCRYFLDHAVRAYGAMRTTPKLKRMNRIIGWIRRKKITEFKLGQLHKDQYHHVESIDDWADAIKELTRIGYLRYASPIPTTRGGWPKPPVYQVNPETFTQPIGENDGV